MIRGKKKTDLVLVDNPALILLVPALMALLVLDDIIDADVLETSPLGHHLTMGCLADAGGTRDDDVR